MSNRPRKTFSREFKIEAVRLLEQGDKESAQLARELGIRRNQLYKWKTEVDRYGKEAFPGHGRRQGEKAGADVETADLKAEVKKLREENEILKKRPFTSRGSPAEICVYCGAKPKLYPYTAM